MIKAPTISVKKGSADKGVHSEELNGSIFNTDIGIWKQGMFASFKTTNSVKATPIADQRITEGEQKTAPTANFR